MAGGQLLAGALLLLLFLVLLIVFHTAHGFAMVLFGGFPLLLIVVGLGLTWIAAMDLKAKKGEAGHDSAA
jgi:hypothetical protein